MRVDPERFVDVLTVAAEQAGAVALLLQSQVRLDHKEGEGSPEAAALTAVDLATQEVILRLLLRELPGVAVDAEEETALVGRFPPAEPGRDLVVLDPVDGTLGYATGSRDYAVMGSLLRDGRQLAAVVHFPAHATTLTAIAGGGARRDGRPVRVAPDDLPALALVTPSRVERWEDPLRAVGLGAQLSRCSAVDATAPVLGRAAVAAARGVPDRRRGVGFLVTTEAGGVVRAGAVRWRGEDPALLPDHARPCVVAASDAVADRVLAALPPEG